MPTFENGESGLSVRTKINDAIEAVEGLELSGTASNPFASVPDLLASNEPSRGVGSIWYAGGYRYEEVASGGAVQTAGGVNLTPEGQWYFEHFGMPEYPLDIRATCQAAIDATPLGRRIEFATKGPYRTSGTLYLKKSDMQIAGPNGDDAYFEYVNASGGSVFSGDEDEELSLSSYLRCKIENIRVNSVSPSTDPHRVVDLTSFSYGDFSAKGQTKRVDAEFYYGQGNAGTSPYWNTITLDGIFGNTDYSQVALRFSQGLWAGGSNGGNANTIRGQGRCAALKGVIDIQSGTGNMIELLNAESIGDWYIRLNYNPSVDAGTSSGSNSQVNINDIAKAWTTNGFVNGAVKITGGTGSGQVRVIGSNTATTITTKEPWGVIPDATSTYEVFQSKASGNQIALGRGEGLASLNPDFIQAHPATRKTNVLATEVQSLGAGLFVRDDSGSSDNNWFNGGKHIFTHTFTNPGPSASVNAYPKVSVFGGMRLAGDYAVEWLKVVSEYTGSGDTADVRLDVGGTAPGNGVMTLHAEVPAGGTVATVFPAEDEKISRDGTNQAIFLNLQTGPAYSATQDVQVTFCVSLV